MLSHEEVRWGACRGDLVRGNVAEQRQRQYNSLGKDCYLFNMNDEIVIDATTAGTIGRFTVRQCCLAKLVHVACEAATIVGQQNANTCKLDCRLETGIVTVSCVYVLIGMLYVLLYAPLTWTQASWCIVT